MSTPAIDTQERKGRLIREGVVKSDKMQKTRIVEVTRLIQHPLVGKVIRRKVKYAVHDEKNESRAGDKVQIQQAKPLSKTKNWTLVKVVKS